MPTLLLCLLVLGGSRPALAHEKRPEIEGGPAPLGCWTTADGCPARSGATATPGVRGPLALGWTFEPSEKGGRIAAPPLVWHDRVYVLVQTEARHIIHVLSLLDGSALVRPRPFRETSMSLGVWQDRLLVHMGPRIELHRVAGGRLKRIEEIEPKQGFHDALLMGDTIHAIDGRDLVAIDATTGKERWRLSGRWHGRIAIRGQEVLAVQSDDIGNTFLVPVDRHTGTAQEKVFIGARGQRGDAPPGRIADIAALDEIVLVLHDAPLKLEGPEKLRASWVRRTAPPAQRGSYEASGILGYDRPPVEGPGGWLVTFDDEKEGHCLSWVRPDEKDKKYTRHAILAMRKRHEAWHRLPVPFSVAGGIGHAGARTFDLETKEILWDGGFEPRFRAVPATGAVLLVDPEGRLGAWRAKGDTVAAGLFLGAAREVGQSPDAAAVRIDDGVVLLVDETVHEGAFEIAGDGSSIALLTGTKDRERRRKVAIGRVAMAVDGALGMVFASSPSAATRTAQRLVFLRRMNDYLRLARDAYRTADTDLMARLIAEADARGAPDSKLAHPRKQVAGLLRRPKKIKEKVRQKLLDKEAAYTKEDRGLLRGAILGALDDPRWPVQRMFIEQLLARGAAPAKATEIVRARMPDYLPAPKRFDPRVWIDLVDQLHGTEATLLARPTKEKGLTRTEREYGSALHTWRDDLIALEAGGLLVMTPMERPGRIAGCLAMGRLVIDALEDLFPMGEDVRTDLWPMILHLYESKERYLAASLRAGVARRREDVEWTAGHFSPSEGLSRIYLPEHPDAWQSVMATYAHELVHHWIEHRCPLFKEREISSSSRVPGYWIVEGVATLIEEYDWDLRRRTFERVNPRAGSLDVVANATPKQLIPWPVLFSMDARQFNRLEPDKDEHEVPMRWRLGYHTVVDRISAFYNQSAAAAHYLNQAGEKERAQLVEYVRLHYTGRLPPGDTIQQVFGISAEELGRRVVAHAKKLNGQR